MIANKHKLRQKSVPVFSASDLTLGDKYRLNTLFTKGPAHFIGTHIAFGCTCCEGGDLIYGYFFASGRLTDLSRTDITVIPEQDVTFDKNGYVRDDGGVLLRSFKLTTLNLANLLNAPEDRHFYGYLTVKSIRRMFSESGLVEQVGG